MSRYVYLCRHGQSLWNAQGILQGQLNCNLSKLGRRQAAELAKKSLKWNIKQIFHSRLDRAIQTAQICANTLNINPQLEPGIEERNFGNWQGKSLTKLIEYQNFKNTCYQQINVKPNQQSESTKQVQKRMQNALNKIVRQSNSGNILIISHGDAINCLLTLWSKSIHLPKHIGNTQFVRLVQQEQNLLLDDPLD